MADRISGERPAPGDWLTAWFAAEPADAAGEPVQRADAGVDRLPATAPEEGLA